MGWKDQIASLIAYRLLPRRVVYWCGVRMMAHASYKLPRREITALTPAEVLKMWEEK